MTQGISHLYLRMDTALLTTCVWLTDQQTRTTSVIYATQPSPNMNGRIMKVIAIYPGFATNLGTLTALTLAIFVIRL